jgi:hypothetical protein
MPARPAKSTKPRRLTAEDRADLDASRRAVREMEARGETPIPWEDAERELDELNRREAEAAEAERDRRRAAYIRARAAARTKPVKARRRAAEGR